ncbi:competence protein CoiA family protein [Bacillus sp. CGMCC 1.16541]|uniref:competence protein CoiA n=1 Tax=Bacillus sp. CGMCC 1.16541 TaxID=2185143 RepID=UPI000D735ED6|nr:competence protein CoiA family protein [Bacillus sp. CGMCC 1.16541]
MLVAKTEEGELFSLANRFRPHVLKELRKTTTFVCPSCQKPVQLKVGTKIIPHFAHLKSQSCCAQHEGETAYHLQGKQQLYHWLSLQSTPELEPYLRTIAQRPDILVAINDMSYAIEFQCANLPPELLVRRTEKYFTERYEPVWILGARRLKRVSQHSFKLSPQEWQYMTQRTPHTLPALFYYSPHDQLFIKLQHLYPFSSQICFAHIKTFPLAHYHFHDILFSRSEELYLLHKEWFQKKKKWRTQYMLYPNKSYRTFLESLYHHQIPPSHFPSEAGVPLSSLYLIDTPACVWQTWLLLDVLVNKYIGSTLSYQQFLYHFKKRIQTKDIKYRHLPLMNVDPYLPLKEYIHALCEMRVLEKVTDTMYKVIRMHTIPEVTNDRFEEDRQVMNMISKISDNNLENLYD